MSQTNIREEYRITTLEVVKLIEDLTSYLTVAKCTQLRNAQIPKVFYKATSSSVVSNKSTALITDKFSVASLTKPAILNNANIALVDAMHHSIQKLEENYFKVRAQHLKYDVIDALTITLIKNDDDLLGTVNSHIKSRRLRARCKTKAADSRYAKASRRRTKKDKDSENSNTSSDVLRLRRRDRAAARAQLAKRKHLLDSDDYCSDSSSDINSKDNSEDEKATTAKDLAREQKERLKALLNAKTRDSLSARIEVQNARAEGNATEHNAVNNDNKLCPTKGKRTFYCACKRSLSFNAEPRQAATMMTTLRFCFFSNSPPENISRLTKEEAIEMQIDTTNAISKALAAANKLVAPQSYTISEANMPAMHSKATKHRLAPLAAQFIIVCSFRKVDKHVFRAYNTISRNIIANVKHDASKHKSSYKYKELISQGAAVAQRFMLKRILKTRDPCLYPDFLSTVQNAEQQCRDILEKEGLNKSEASRRVIFNCFKMQAIASYPALATLKAAQFKTYGSCKVKRFTLNSVKDLFTNLSKDHFLVREARAITKSSLKEKFSNESVLVMQRVASIAFAEAITLTEATHVLAEMYIGIVYFNLDSELELKVLGKQDVKTTS
ncbi:hypothetical protein HBI76_163490 [Parastagonospora nodorum]|nr:hypothetical protein HBI76_163490 [Parastagonospora nodorum]